MKIRRIHSLKMLKMFGMPIGMPIRVLCLMSGLLLTPLVSQAQTIQIGSLVASQVTQVYVKTGQTVQAGQLLMTLDDSRFRAKLKGLRAIAEVKRLKFADSQIELNQALDLYDRTVTAKRTLDAAQLAHDLAKQAYIQAQANVEFAQAWSKYYKIKAPVGAKVKKIFAPQGTTVFQENTPLIQLER